MMLSMETIAARIQLALDNADIKWSAAAIKIGLSAQAASNWKKGKIGRDTVEKLAALLEVDAGWLLTGNSPENHQLTDGKPSTLDNNVVQITAKLLPVLSWVQAGTMTSVETIDPSEINEWLPPLSLDDPDGCFYLRVVGVSNYPTYIEGDCILVNPRFQVCDLLSGDLIVVRNNSDATFKKFVIESDERKYLQALNPNFHPNIIEFEEGMQLVGLVIDAFRPLGGSRIKRTRKS